MAELICYECDKRWHSRTWRTIADMARSIDEHEADRGHHVYAWSDQERRERDLRFDIHMSVLWAKHSLTIADLPPFIQRRMVG